ncbi:hypothetical protein [Streptomyces fulvorobeus]|uniref:hypothetical protein n=1 Tax=Streptomyces fulvorobeus TaxID=284028 RepID=UPI001566590A|nr:hypothetical protein [Streptomyces fulvorobeus]
MKLYRAAAHLTTTFPEISIDDARERAGRMLERYPHARTGRLGEYLVFDESLGRVIDETGNTSAGETP